VSRLGNALVRMTDRHDQVALGVVYAARRLWCGVVGHQWKVDQVSVGQPSWCGRCNWWGGFTVMGVSAPPPASGPLVSWDALWRAEQEGMRLERERMFPALAAILKAAGGEIVVPHSVVRDLHVGTQVHIIEGCDSVRYRVIDPRDPSAVPPAKSVQ
jgi:hypothetical protein